MFLDGFVLSMFRSFGPDPQLIGPLGKINIIVGQNNSGKSNILLYLKEHLRSAIQDMVTTQQMGAQHNKQVPNDLDTHIGRRGPKTSGLALSLSGNKYDDLLQHWNTLFSQTAGSAAPMYLELTKSVLNSVALSHQTSTAWFLYEAPSIFQDELVRELATESNIFEKFNCNWMQLHAAFARAVNPNMGISSPADPKLCVPLILSQLSPCRNSVPQIDLIPALRRVGDVGSTSTTLDFSGIGIIAKLATLQSPIIEELHKEQLFEKINEFLREVLGKPSATLSIPHDQSAIYARVDGRKLPLSSLGTGVHQVIILAAAATIVENQILCIEEPELHLHPILQRKLLRYLKDKTNNQYFITTHSAHLLDTPGVHIFHVRHHDGESRVEQAFTSTARANICFDLGYRASDLVQANSIIWVEGPTERLYLTHWIKAVDPHLIEGLHYSIMFYGGRLLSHLTAHDPEDFEVKEFISLRRLNRFISVVMDSDRTSAEADINPTKTRIREEFNKEAGFAWVTQGREIENYIPPALLEECVKNTHRAAASLTDTGQYAHPYLYTKADGTRMEEVKNIDKTKLARAVIEKPADLSVLDLKENIEKLVNFIHKANDDEVA